MDRSIFTEKSNMLVIVLAILIIVLGTYAMTGMVSGP